MSLRPEEIRLDILKVLILAVNGELDTYEIYEELKDISDFYKIDCRNKIDGNISVLWKKGQIEKIGSRNDAGIWKIRV